MAWPSADSKFMRRCLLLAQKGEGKVSPNPLVGAVVVKNGKIIGEGFHKKFGGPHAEANALLGIDAKGATLFVSLEPCSHRGHGKKTPPCVPLIIKSGVKRVVVAARDANPKVHGIEGLKAAGIHTEVGLLGTEARQQNEAFFKFMETGKPFVVLKMAQSSNGKIGIMGKGNVRISGRQFDRYSQFLRNRYDAILVGINTVLADNPRLTSRIPGARNPARIILDSRLKIPLAANALKNARKEKVIIATGKRMDGKKAAALRRMGAKVLVCGKKKADLAKLLAQLPKSGIISVLAEGGAEVMKSFIAARLADKIIIAVSPKQIKSKNAIASPFSSAFLKKLERRKFGNDTVYEGYVGFKP